MEKGIDNLIELQDLAIDNKADVVDKFRQYLIQINNPYNFNVNGLKVNVVFSSKKNAPNMERALVKIASKRGEQVT